MNSNFHKPFIGFWQSRKAGLNDIPHDFVINFLGGVLAHRYLPNYSYDSVALILGRKFNWPIAIISVYSFFY